MAVLVRMTVAGMDKPNVPGEIQQEVIELHGVLQP
jgi:hypothetical protein